MARTPPHRRRGRPVHSSPWPARALTAGLVVGVVAIGWHHSEPVPVVVQSTEHGDVCLALLVVRDALLMDRPPPPYATTEQVVAAAEINAYLATVRERLFRLDGIRQLGCREGG